MINREWFYRGSDTEESEEERKIGWLELFYDLVYVATFIQLGNVLSHDVSVGGFVRFVALFIPIWLAWTGIMFFVNRFPIDDVGHRLMVFLQMGAIAVMAISAEEAFGEHFAQFVLAYVAARVILALLYLRAWFAVPEARPLAAGFGASFMLGAAIWFVSIFFPEPINYVIWIIGVVVELVVPLTPGVVKWQRTFSPDTSHLAERYGIFTIIVLGKSFIKSINSLAGTAVDLSLLLVGALGLGVLFGLWWLYFDDIGGSHVSRTARFGPYIWIYSHLPVAVGITAYGVGVKKILGEPFGEPFADKYRLLICAALVIFLLFIGLVDHVTTRERQHTMPNPTRALWRWLAVILLIVLALLGGPLTSGVFMAIVALIFVGQIAVERWSSTRPSAEAAG